MVLRKTSTLKELFFRLFIALASSHLLVPNRSWILCTTRREFHIVGGNESQARVFNIIHFALVLSVQYYTLRSWVIPMRRQDFSRDKPSLLQSRDKATRMKQVLVSIGRAMKERYDVAQPLPDALGDLVKKLERSTSAR
jgi:hypothetical protein